MSDLLKEMFGVPKPVIAMAHFPALPGTPRYDPSLGVQGIVERMRQDIRYLLDGGVDAIMFCNEDDRPYTFHADFEGEAVMTRVITELRPTDRPLTRICYRDRRKEGSFLPSIKPMRVGRMRGVLLPTGTRRTELRDRPGLCRRSLR